MDGSPEKTAPDDHGLSTVLYVVSGNAAQSEVIKRLMMSYYVVEVFTDAERALAMIEQKRPTAVVVDDYVPPLTGEGFVAKMRLGTYGKEVPLVYAFSDNKDGTEPDLHFPGSVRYIKKPCSASDLATSISAQANVHVEQAWEKVEPVQRSALKNTLDSFNNLADLIDQGEPVPYDSVKESCSPLIQAVQNNNFKDILGGVRNHDNYSYVHSMRVATLLTLFGSQMGFKGDDLAILSSGGLLHDVGKMQIPHLVLNKPGKLTDEEFVEMKSHVTKSIDYLELNKELPRGVIIIAGQHHEKIDGTGYPYGLKGAELNELARMASIIDVFGALTDRRVYKDPMVPEKAFEIMESFKGHLDLQFLALFKDILLSFDMDAGKDVAPPAA